MTFSERYGYKKAREAIQVESIDAALRNSLWNMLQLYIWNEACGAFLSNSGNEALLNFCTGLWCDYFKMPLDDLDDDWDNTIEEIKVYFFSCKWHEVYDFMEFAIAYFPHPIHHQQFVNGLNKVLERELTGYRVVKGEIVRITDKTELEEIDTAIDTATGPVRTHLNRALQLLADRKSPDYRNSIKESISAVESLVSATVGAKGTLGQLIKQLEDEIKLHPALVKTFGTLYGFTSDADGIRHALMDLPTLTFEDAKFFLVVCSAFVNFVQARVVATSSPSSTP